MFRPLGLVCVVVIHASFVTPQLRAQYDGMMELYGEGVHRYFAGDLAGADELLSRVINSGSQDPRAYYFRGLVRERQGGGGQYDFEQGARIEAEGRKSVAVGHALTRIQGSVRGLIEKSRRDARAMFQQQKMLMDQAKQYAPTPGAVVPGDSQEMVPAAPSETDSPFADGMRSSNTQDAAEQPTAPEVDSSTNPFEDDPAPTPDSSPAADPFGGSTTPAADPFGGDAGSAAPADPFGGDAGSAAPADPFGGAGDAGAASDPFGGDSPF